MPTDIKKVLTKQSPVTFENEFNGPEERWHRAKRLNSWTSLSIFLADACATAWMRRCTASIETRSVQIGSRRLTLAAQRLLYADKTNSYRILVL
jgi:hypothetical protein